LILWLLLELQKSMALQIIMASNSWHSLSLSSMKRIIVNPTGSNRRFSRRLVLGGRYNDGLSSCFSTTNSSSITTTKAEANQKPPTILLLLAKPGGGKGTISSKILQVWIKTKGLLASLI
jgi:hypothetical protein